MVQSLESIEVNFFLCQLRHYFANQVLFFRRTVKILNPKKFLDPNLARNVSPRSKTEKSKRHPCSRENNHTKRANKEGGGRS